MYKNRSLLLVLLMACALIVYAYSIQKTENLQIPIVSETVRFDNKDNSPNQKDLMNGKIFEVVNPDTKLSPYTGMTRDH